MAGISTIKHRPSISDAEPSDLLLDYGPSEDVWGPPGSPVPTLDEACLPFIRGALNFGSGMGVKMAVTRLQQVRLLSRQQWIVSNPCFILW